jgi:hypothetical protein
MWMWLLVRFSIYHTFITSLLIFFFWNENFQIDHMVSKHNLNYVNDMIQYTFNFHKNENYLNYFLEFIFVFEYMDTIHLFPQIYSNLPLYKMKWNIYIFRKLYSNMICKNIVKIFQKFEVGYTQTCTSIESSTMWHPKGGPCSVLSHYFIIWDKFI